jgi:arylsulfatase A-like enzyme
MNSFITKRSLFAILTTWFILVISSFVTAAEKPNIVVILADDWGVGDVKFYGGKRSKIDTPHMDKLAKQGMAFTDAHSSSAVCTPTRYSLLTGRYNWRSRLKSSVLFGFSPPLIETERQTVASMLGKAGYHTACIGKWHLGMNMPTTDGKPADSKARTPEELETKCNVDWKGKITGGPTDLGFDHFYGISASLDMPPYIWIEDDRFVGECTTIKSFKRRGPAHKDFQADEVLSTLTKRASAYVTEQAKTQEPFFLYLPLNSPHTPIAPSEAFKGKSGLGKYADFVMETDWAIGEVIQAVEKAGIADDTLIIVTADNGTSGASLKGMTKNMSVFTTDQGLSQDMSKHYSSSIYRGQKADIFEGGHRVPFVARWDDRIKAGSESDQTICLVDLFATMADLVGADYDDESAEDSVSILLALKGTASKPIRKAVVHHSFNGSFALRQGRWKLAFCPGSGSWNPPAPKTFKQDPKSWVQLYDLDADASEQNNLAIENPEIVKRMTQLMQKYIDQGRSTTGKPQTNDGEKTQLYPGWMHQRMR